MEPGLNDTYECRPHAGGPLEALNSGSRILIVEDHPIVRLGLRQVLAGGGLVAIEDAASIQAALACLDAFRPDLVIADLGLGEEDGYDLLAHIRDGGLGVPVLVFSMFDDLAHVQRALNLGARGYVTKGEAQEHMVEAARACLAGGRYASPIIQRLLEAASPVRAGLDALSLQERMVYGLLGQGHPLSAIAARLDLSPRTVESYYLRIQVKLGLRGMKDLRREAITHPL